LRDGGARGCIDSVLSPVADSVLAVAFSLAPALLLNVSLVFGLLALFGPASAMGRATACRPPRPKRMGRV
jgi:hypothetical protein